MLKRPPAVCKTTIEFYSTGTAQLFPFLKIIEIITMMREKKFKQENQSTESTR